MPKIETWQTAGGHGVTGEVRQDSTGVTVDGIRVVSRVDGTPSS